MNARTKRLTIDLLTAILLSVLLAYIGGLLQPYIFGYDLGLSLLPIVWLALRYGPPSGIIGGAGAGLITGLLAGTGDWSVIILYYTLPMMFAGIAGLFAKYTQKTLNNRRYSSTYLNIFTGSLLASLAYYLLKYGLAPYTLGHTEDVAVTDPDFWISLAAGWVLISLILSLMAKFNPSTLIPKRTKYLSRKETSSLLND